MVKPVTDQKSAIVDPTDDQKSRSVSIVCCSRGRPDLLRKTLESLERTCSNTSEVEILLKIDFDDPCDKDYISLLESSKFACKIIVGERLNGYWSIFRFLDDLCKISLSPLIWLFADDVIVVEGDWLRILSETRGTFLDNIYTLYVPLYRKKKKDKKITMKNKCVIPVITREWFNVMHRVSTHIRLDGFVQEVSKNVGRLVRTPELDSIKTLHVQKKIMRHRVKEGSDVGVGEVFINEVNKCTILFKKTIKEREKK